MAKVKVEILAEQFTYSYKNPDGTHTREDYVRGQIFEMDEEDALKAAEGAEPKPMEIVKNAAGTEVWSAPPKPIGVPRAAVRILGPAAKVTTPVTAPEKKEIVTPAIAPKPVGMSK